MQPFVRLLASAAICLVASSCHDGEPSPQVGSNTNWLRACVSDEDCSPAFSCECGACTKACGNDEDCGQLADARCVFRVDATAQMLCTASEQWSEAGICLPRCEFGECDEAQVCAMGACVPMPLPDGDLCSPLAERGVQEKVREDELLALLQTARQGGAVTCPDGTAANSSAVLRIDSRLVCEARYLAGDLLLTGALSSVDSQGRSTATRLDTLGYVATGWVETFCTDVSTAQGDFEQVMGNNDFCRALIDPATSDLGFGVAGAVGVLIVGSQ